MKRLLMCFSVVIVVTVTSRTGQAQNGRTVLRLDPALDSLVSSDTRVEVLKTNYFTRNEGLVWVKDGQYLLISDMGANRIYKWTPGTPEGGVSVFLERAGFHGELSALSVRGVVLTKKDDRPVYLGADGTPVAVGPIGLSLDREGRLLICTLGDRTLDRLEKDGKRTTLADRYQGKRLDGPNDLVVKSDGSVYFTDTGGGIYDKEFPASVYRWKNGASLQLLARDVQGGTSNGIAFSPDEKYLYVGVVPRPDWHSAPRGSIVHYKIMRYRVQPDGSVADEHVFVDLPVEAAAPYGEAGGYPDGVKVDRRGNLWFGGPGGVWIVSPEGKHLGTVHNQYRTVNLTFGDPDGAGLYITTYDGLVRLRLKSPAI